MLPLPVQDFLGFLLLPMERSRGETEREARREGEAERKGERESEQGTEVKEMRKSMYINIIF